MKIEKLKKDIFDIVYCLKYKFKEKYDKFIKGIYISIPDKKEWIYLNRKTELNKIYNLRQGDERIIEFKKPLIYFFISGEKYEINKLPYEIQFNSLKFVIKRILKDLKIEVEIIDEREKYTPYLSNGEILNAKRRQVYFVFNPEMLEVRAIIIIKPPFIIGKLRDGEKDSPIKINNLNLIIEENFKISEFEEGGYVNYNKGIYDEGVIKKYFKYFEKIYKENEYLILKLSREKSLKDIFKDEELLMKIIKKHKNELILDGENKVYVTDYQFDLEDKKSEFAFLVRFSKEFKEFLEKISDFFK